MLTTPALVRVSIIRVGCAARPWLIVPPSATMATPPFSFTYPTGALLMMVPEVPSDTGPVALLESEPPSKRTLVHALSTAMPYPPPAALPLPCAPPDDDPEVKLLNLIFDGAPPELVNC